MDKNTGGQAFPVQFDFVNQIDDLSRQEGMTLRDWFAGQILCGTSFWDIKENDTEYIARRCYEIADAMIKERDK